jgi:transposase
VCGTACTGSCSKSCPRAQLLDWSRGCIDAVSVRAKGGELSGRNPTDRGKADSKYHLLCDANGLPLHALISAANTHDSKLFEPLLDTNPGVSRPRPPWAATTSAREAARGQGLRLPALPRLPAPARDQGPHRPPRCRVQHQAVINLRRLVEAEF